MPITPGLMSYSYHLTLRETGLTHTAFLDRAAGLGLRAVEWCHGPFHFPGAFDEAAAHEVRRLSDRRGLRSHLSGFARILSEGADVEEMLAWVDTQLRVTRIFGAQLMRFDGMVNQTLRVNAPKPMPRCLDNLRRVLERAETAGVVLAIENHMDFNSEEMLWLLERLDSPYAALTFDVGNLIPRMEHPLRFAREMLPHIANVHFKSVEFLFEEYGATLTSVPAEESAVDLRELLRILHGSPRDVTLHIEVVARRREDEDPLVEDLAAFVLRETAALDRAAQAAVGGAP